MSGVTAAWKFKFILSPSDRMCFRWFALTLADPGISYVGHIHRKINATKPHRRLIVTNPMIGHSELAS